MRATRVPMLSETGSSPVILSKNAFVMKAGRIGITQIEVQVIALSAYRPG